VHAAAATAAAAAAAAAAATTVTAAFLGDAGACVDVDFVPDVQATGLARVPQRVRLELAVRAAARHAHVVDDVDEIRRPADVTGGAARLALVLAHRAVAAVVVGLLSLSQG
jgi:hypothetical protein